MKRAAVYVWRGTELIDCKPTVKAAREAYPGDYKKVYNGLRAGDVLLQSLKQVEVQ